MSFEHLRLERDEGVVRLVLDRPPLNVLHIPMLRELSSALGEVATDPEARVLVIAGAGRGFCAGVDVADHTPDRVDAMLETFHEAVVRLLRLDLPVLAAVHGAALGGGCELAMAADFVWASEGAKLGQPEVRLGAIPPVAAALLPRLIGRQHALDLILSGRVIGAEEARRLGLVGRVHPEGELEAAVMEYARGLASLSRPVLALAKRATTRALDRPLEMALEEADAVYREEVMRLADAREGLAAFMEKREPVWSDA